MNKSLFNFPNNKAIVIMRYHNKHVAPVLSPLYWHIMGNQSVQRIKVVLCNWLSDVVNVVFQNKLSIFPPQHLVGNDDLHLEELAKADVSLQRYHTGF